MIYPFHSTDLTESLPIALRLFGVSHLQPPVKRPDGVPYFQWFYCVKGHGELILNNQRSVITKGQGFLIYPDQEHVYQAISNDWTLHIAAFNGPLCAEILTLLQMGQSGAYHFSDNSVFEQHMQKLLWLYENRTNNQTLSYSKECYDFLLDLSRCITHTHELHILMKILLF